MNIQERISHLDYWDARVLKLSSDYFYDEITLVYEAVNNNVTLKFLKCYKSLVEHSLDHIKDYPLSNLSRGQLPYFLQDIKMDEIKSGSINIYKFKILMFPITMEIWCEDIQIMEDRE